MINGKWRRSLQDVRVRRGADVGSDHHLVTANVKLKLMKQATPHRVKKFDTGKLKDPRKKQEFKLELRNRFRVLENLAESDEQGSVEENWQRVQKTYRETSEKILGYRRQVHKEWITPGTWKLIDKRRVLKKRVCQTQSERVKDRLREQYSECNKQVKLALRKDKKDFTERMAQDAEKAAGEQRMGEVYQITIRLCGKGRNVNTPVKDKQGVLLTSEKEQQERWAEHFKEVLNRPDPETTADIPEAEDDLDICTEVPSKEEIQEAIKSLMNNKAPGNDQLTAELFKTDPITATEILHPFFQKIWENNTIPTTWSEGTIVKIPKKGDLTNCNKWRGITLLSIPSKIFCKILVNRMKTAVDTTLRKEQAGFRRGKGCSDNIFILRTIIEQCTEWQRELIINFIDFEKAFDSLHRDSIWKILRNYGIPPKIVSIIKLFYAEFRCTVG